MQRESTSTRDRTGDTNYTNVRRGTHGRTHQPRANVNAERQLVVVHRGNLFRDAAFAHSLWHRCLFNCSWRSNLAAQTEGTEDIWLLRHVFEIVRCDGIKVRLPRLVRTASHRFGRIRGRVLYRPQWRLFGRHRRLR